MTEIEIQLYGAFRDHGKASSVQLTLGEGATIADLRAAFAEQLDSDKARALLTSSAFADDEHVLGDADPVPTRGAVAVLPPVSGG